MGQDTGRGDGQAPRPERRLGEDAPGGLTYIKRHTGWHLSGEPPVILVRVCDDHPQQRWVGSREPRDRRQRDRFMALGRERPSHVQHQTRASGFHLDAATPNLVGATVDANSHAYDVRPLTSPARDIKTGSQ